MLSLSNVTVGATPPETSLCFGSAWHAMIAEKLTVEEYFGQLLAHFKGVRHPEDASDEDNSIRGYNLPVLSSIRENALRDDYQALEDTTFLEHLFKSCLAGNTAQVRADLEDISTNPVLPLVLQPLATLAAHKGHAEILQLCIDEGVVFDQHLDAKITYGATNLKMLEVIWKVNWQDIQNSQHTKNLLLLNSLRRDTELVAWLLEHGTQVDTKNVRAATWYTQDVPKMKLVMENYGVSKLKDALKDTGALQMAAKQGHLDALEFLLDAGLDMEEVLPALDPREPRLSTAIYEGVMAERTDVVRLLLDRGARWDTICRLESGTAWQLAKKKGNAEIINLFKLSAGDLEEVEISKPREEL